MLIDVHAHFLHDRSPRTDWRERNASRLRAGERVGITVHVASILGSWGATSPIYFPSPSDIEYGNNFLLALQREHAAGIRGYAVVNPNFQRHALSELARCLDARHGWNQAGGEPPGGRSSAGSDLSGCRASAESPYSTTSGNTGGGTIRDRRRATRSSWERWRPRHPGVNFLLAHIGGGGDWIHSLAAIRSLPNVYVDLSGSGVDGGMLEACVEAVGVERLVWGCDLTIDTGWAKLRYLEHLLSPTSSN